MAYVNVNGRPVDTARLCFPLTGAWHADLYATGADALTGAVDIDLGGALTLRGTVLTGGTYIESQHVRVLAGKGGWLSPCVVKFYQGATLGTMLANVLQQAGEALSNTSAAAVRNVPVPAFASTAGTVGANVRALMAYAPAGTSWRFLSDGTFWVGPETWPAFGEAYTVTGEQPRERRARVGFEVPTLLPGQTIALSSGAVVHVNHVETDVSASGMYARAWWES